MANPLSPGVRVSKPEQKSYGGITDYSVPMTPRPKSKQGNVSSGSNFSHGAMHPSNGGNSDKYRVPGTIKRRSGTGVGVGFGGVKRPVAGQSPRGIFPARRAGNFGRV